MPFQLPQRAMPPAAQPAAQLLRPRTWLLAAVCMLGAIMVASGLTYGAVRLAQWDGMTPNRWLSGALVVLGIAAAALGLSLLANAPLTAAPAAASPHGAPARLRRIYGLALAGFSVLVIYGSLVPLKYHSLPWQSALDAFSALRFQPLGVGSRSDFAGNILLFIPFAYLSAALLTCRRASLWSGLVSAVAAAAISAIFSVATQFPQLWFPDREASFNDIVANTIGGALGGLAYLAVGKTIEQWCSSYLALRTSMHFEQFDAAGGNAARLLAQQRRIEIHWLLGWYVIGLAIYSVLPLDITISPAELYHRVRGGAVRPIPFSDFDGTLLGFYKAAKDIVTFIPVGMACTALLLRPGQGLRSLAVSTALGAGIAALIELAQLFIHSHITSATTIALAAGGSWAGAAIMHRLARGSLSESPAAWSPTAMRRAAGICLALMGVYALVLLLEFCAGGVWESDPARLWKRFHTMWRPPLSALYWGSEANAVGDIVRKVVFYIPLGALGAGAALALNVSHRGFKWAATAVIFYAAAVAFTIEMLQVYLPTRAGDPTGPSHVADIGDVMLCTAGAAMGMFLMRRVLVPAELHYQRTPPE